MNILVTGIAGDIGSGIGRILRECDDATRLIGSDVHEEHMGRLLFDECHVVPRAGDPGYLDALGALIQARGIDVVVPTSEGELRYFSRTGVVGELGKARLIMANPRALDIGFDKLRTAQFLESLGLPFPWTRLVHDGDPVELPCIVKSRFGAGSKEVQQVHDAALVDCFRRISPGHIWQEYLGTAAQEYTCGVFRFSPHEARIIVFRRRLTGGMTSYGEVVENSEIRELCRSIAGACDLEGSINIQLRTTTRGPVVFEINPRFSSTVVFRHLLGFRDLLWSIAARTDGVLPDYEPPKAGTKICRQYAETISR